VPSTEATGIASSGRLRAADDAADAGVFTARHLPRDIAFDHRDILRDYFKRRY
jgi:ADP-ribose pyrophosphatase YjhB (NUDIX family)